MLDFQIPLPLGFQPCFESDDFFVSECNRAATQAVRSETHQRFIVHGAVACGKSHLLHIYARLKDATILTESQLHKSFAKLDIDGAKAFAVDDADMLSAEAQTTLFHLYNHCWQSEISLLLGMSHPPQEISGMLADLQSRLCSLTNIPIGRPDDELLKHFLRKNFADRQLYPKDEVLDFALQHWPRDFACLRALVRHCDRLMLAKRQTKLSKQNIKQTLKLYNDSLIEPVMD